MNRSLMLIVFVFVLCAASIGFILIYQPTANEDTALISIDDEIPALGADNSFNAYIELLSDGNGTIEVAPFKISYQEGKKIKLTAHPNKGWIFAYWAGDIPNDLAFDHEINITLPRGKYMAVAVFTEN